MGLIAQEVSQERYIEIPDEILDIYKIWRPTPLVRARSWEKALGTPAKIYYKWEGVSPAGSHKPNTAVAQAWYNKEEGVKRITTETGAGQWGSALALACNFFGIECKVYMVRVSYDQKPYRRLMMQTWGATCIPSPSDQTNAGRKILETDPDTPGSLGIAISEAVEEAATREDTKYSLGSVLNHVMLHQTIIGLESLKQFEMAGDYPDVVIGCAGGGSNFAGFAFPFVRDKIVDGKKTKVVAVEPKACPTLTKGLYKYDFGDTACTTPLIRMHTLGHDFIPAPLHAGGLRYHGMAPSVSHLYELGLIEARAYHQKECFDAALGFARAEGHLLAPGNLPCRQGGHGRSPGLQGERRGEGHRLQRQRPRPLRHGRLREVLRRRPGGLRLSGGEGQGGAGEAAAHRLSIHAVLQEPGPFPLTGKRARFDFTT